VILALITMIAGCASDRGFHCGGDLVPINPPAKTVRSKPQPAARAARATGDPP
jgi:hypothetical protein